MITDPIADMLTRIRNAQSNRANEVKTSTSKFKVATLRVLKKNNYITDFAVKNNDIIIKLNYISNKPKINKIQRVSKPGLRIYTKSKKMPKVLQGFGILIVSTPEGVMTGEDAKRRNLGGEVICKIY